MMSQSGVSRYLEEDGFQAIALPYGAGQVAFYVFLPSKGSSLEAFLARLDSQTWSQWMAISASGR